MVDKKNSFLNKCTTFGLSVSAKSVGIDKFEVEVIGAKFDQYINAKFRKYRMAIEAMTKLYT